jgi:hypothetical protein
MLSAAGLEGMGFKDSEFSSFSIDHFTLRVESLEL